MGEKESNGQEKGVMEILKSRTHSFKIYREDLGSLTFYVLFEVI